MAAQRSEPDTLDQLQSPEQIELLDAIDKLRNQGLGHYDISIPQLIVCGDQSSGKSSLLEGLTRLRFPTQDGLCTTFATEVVLRRQESVDIICTIIPGKNRTQAQRLHLAEFRRYFAAKDQFLFPSLLGDARKQMAFGSKLDASAFFEDILQIRYSGPDLPSLTIVDLPGLIQSQIEGERGKGTELVHELVKGYMRDEKSIILAVVSARNDPENQVVFKYVRDFDPTARRTLGIITKPDTLDVGSESESRFIRLTKNEIMPFELGWHAVKNRGYGMSEQSDTERDESEKQFFSKGLWRSLPRKDIGIATLRTKLSHVLLRHIRRELPSLISTIQSAISTTEYSLQGLGSPRDETQQQRNYLSQIAQTFQVRTQDALRGIRNSFFKNCPEAKLRNEVQNLNLAFAHAMYRKGHRWEITNSQYSPAQGCSHLPPSDIQNYAACDGPTTIERSRFIEQEIVSQMTENRTEGIITLVSPWVLGEVFRRQSQPWQAIAEQHLKDVFDAVETYLNVTLESMMDPQTFGALLCEHIEPELDVRRKRLDAKLAELLRSHQEQEPMIYDPEFFRDLKQIRDRRYFESKKQFNFGADDTTHLLTDGDDFTTSEILNLMHSYYKRAIAAFISNVTVLAIENCLVADIGSIFTPDLVWNMEEDQLRLIAAESEDIRTERLALKQKLEDLKAGKRVLDLQARRSGRVPRNSLGSQRAGATLRPTEPQAPRPQTPPSKVDQLDSITAVFNNLAVTPPPAAEKDRQPAGGSRDASPLPTKIDVSQPSPKWQLRAASKVESEDESPITAAFGRQPILSRA